MNKQNTEAEKDIYFLLFIKISIAFLIVAIIFPFAINAVFSDWSKSGTFGDSFGALNAIFSGLALSGVVVTILIQRTELKNQRIELSLQRNEMQETRKEFLLNRTTSLVFTQLDRFDKALAELQITHKGISYLGNEAISFLDKNENQVYKFEKSDEEFKTEMKSALIELLKIYTPNKSKIEKFSHNTFNSVEVLKRLIFKTDLEVEELNNLKNLFFVNIGFINMGVIERISEVAKLQFEYLEPVDYMQNNIDISAIQLADTFLKSVNNFYRLRLTEENFKENKLKWLESIGNLEK